MANIFMTDRTMQIYGASLILVALNSGTLKKNSVAENTATPIDSQSFSPYEEI